MKQSSFYVLKWFPFLDMIRFIWSPESRCSDTHIWAISIALCSSFCLQGRFWLIEKHSCGKLECWIFVRVISVTNENSQKRHLSMTCCTWEELCKGKCDTVSIYYQKSFEWLKQCFTHGTVVFFDCTLNALTCLTRLNLMFYRITVFVLHVAFKCMLITVTHSLTGLFRLSPCYLALVHAWLDF